MAFVGKYERMNAQRAYELGMISQIVDPPDRLRDEAQALAGLTQARTFTWTGAAATLGRAYTDAWARRQGR